jgi:hypothetical protein
VIFISKFLFVPFNVLFLASVLVGVASAQESDSSGKYHPFLSDSFNIGLGVYRPYMKTVLGGSVPIGGGASDSIEGTNTQSTGSLNFRWRFTKNWSFQGTYWATDSAYQETLTKNFTFTGDQGEEIVFKAGSFIGIGLDTTIARLFVGRSFFRKSNHDFGVGAGLHWMELDAYVEGQIDTAPPGPTTEFRHEDASASVPLPNLGIWYMYSWSPKWVLVTRLDWLDVTIDEISGSMYDVSAGVNYQMSRHFGLGFAVNGFLLDVKVNNNTGWRGGLETSQLGPRLNVTWSW